MNRILIEAKKPETSEYSFLETVVRANFPDKPFEIICMDGVANLFGQAMLNKIRVSRDDGDNVIAILDADTADKKWGYDARKRDVTQQYGEE